MSGPDERLTAKMALLLGLALGVGGGLGYVAGKAEGFRQGLQVPRAPAKRAPVEQHQDKLRHRRWDA